MRYTIGHYIPLIGPVAKGIADLVYLPQTIMELPEKLVWKVASYSWRAQHQIAGSVKNHSDQKLQEALVLEGQKAYLVWMAQCKIAREQGISFLAG